MMVVVVVMMLVVVVMVMMVVVTMNSRSEMCQGRQWLRESGTVDKSISQYLIFLLSL
jgi:hypothetical protein